AKTAGARQGSKVAEPLNRYIRKLYDNSIGLSQAGLDALKDSVEAIQQVVDHINEDTGFFKSHPALISRLVELEHEVDVEISRLAEMIDATTNNPVLSEPEPAVAPSAEIESSASEESASEEIPALEVEYTPTASETSDETLSASDIFATTNVFDAGDDAEVIEIEPTDANALDMMNWSFEHFPQDKPSPSDAAA